MARASRIAAMLPRSAAFPRISSESIEISFSSQKVIILLVANFQPAVAAGTTESCICEGYLVGVSPWHIRDVSCSGAGFACRRTRRNNGCVGQMPDLARDCT